MADLSAYNDYEEEFLRMSRELQNRISALRNQDDDKRGAERSQAELKSIETDLWQAKQQLADMETEVRGLPDGTRRELGNKISTYRDSINSLQKDLEKVKNRINRNSLMESGGGDDMRVCRISISLGSALPACTASLCSFLVRPRLSASAICEPMSDWRLDPIV
eukprot:gb/GECG01000818.1/.p1 GENE.gb/GECG01000818.1/~~gb/GECG01000818.1/.p1  ORF type:complete len:164 (+),score=14.83 gb/GECG01000818.1/:1-492(+)